MNSRKHYLKIKTDKELLVYIKEGVIHFNNLQVGKITGVGIEWDYNLTNLKIALDDGTLYVNESPYKRIQTKRGVILGQFNAKVFHSFLTDYPHTNFFMLGKENPRVKTRQILNLIKQFISVYA